jgi:hypothetical protein
MGQYIRLATSPPSVTDYLGNVGTLMSQSYEPPCPVAVIDLTFSFNFFHEEYTEC